MAYFRHYENVIVNPLRAMQRAMSHGSFKRDHVHSKQKEEFTEAEKLIGITEESHEQLMTISTVFPFTLFPDTVSVDRQKLTIVKRDFFMISHVVSVQLADVLNVEVDTGPFFGSLKLASKYFIDNHQEVNFLKRNEAIEFQRLLQGFLVAHHREIDCSNISKDELLTLLTDLGQGPSQISI